MASISRRSAGYLAALVLGAVVAGCSETEFGESITLPRERHASVVDEFARGRPLRLPGDATLNLADSQRSATGAGAAESSADSSGRARAVASAPGRGAAAAEFQLGHVLDNRGDAPLDVTARFDVDYACRLESDPADLAKEADTLGVRVFIRDSNRRVLGQMTLTQTDQFSGPAQWSGRQTPSFEVTLEPGLAYYFVLAGRATATGTEDTPVSAEITVHSLAVELTPRKSGEPRS